MAIVSQAGCDMSKCCRGGLHQPPLSLGRASLGGQKLVAVMVMDVPGLHHCVLLESQVIVKHAPHDAPLLKSAVLSAAVVVPYPALYRLPYPHAPPALMCNLRPVQRKPRVCNMQILQPRFRKEIYPWCPTRRCRRRMWQRQESIEQRMP